MAEGAKIETTLTTRFFVSRPAFEDARHQVCRLLPFLRRLAACSDLYISEHTDWSEWFVDYDFCKMGWWLYMPEMSTTSLEAIEIYESFGEFPT